MSRLAASILLACLAVLVVVAALTPAGDPSLPLSTVGGYR